MSQDDDVQLLPNVQRGEKGTVYDVHVKEGKTQPPKRYTEGELITLMKTAGKFLDDEQLEKVISKNRRTRDGSDARLHYYNIKGAKLYRK
ncbi:DNA topoisomerase 3 [Anoxybacillus sp. BCO1]|nr:DNA topoisomerase 3 [Anoxybacillus sp. BCO1]